MDAAAAAVLRGRACRTMYDQIGTGIAITPRWILAAPTAIPVASRPRFLQKLAERNRCS